MLHEHHHMNQDGDPQDGEPHDGEPQGGEPQDGEPQDREPQITEIHGNHGSQASRTSNYGHSGSNIAAFIRRAVQRNPSRAIPNQSPHDGKKTKRKYFTLLQFRKQFKNICLSDQIWILFPIAYQDPCNLKIINFYKICNILQKKG